MLEELRAIASGCDQNGSSSHVDRADRRRRGGIVRVAARRGTIEEAAAALEAVDGVRDFPVTAATLAELYENHLNDRKAARDVLERATAAAGKAVVEHRLSEAQRMRLVLGVAAGKMRDGEYESAAESTNSSYGRWGRGYSRSNRGSRRACPSRHHSRGLTQRRLRSTLVTYLYR